MTFRNTGCPFYHSCGKPANEIYFLRLKLAFLPLLTITQRSLQSALIFRLLLKITVERLRECVSFYFLSPQGVHAYDECNPCFRSVQSANNGQPANESSFQWFKTSPDFALPLTWISHVVSPKRLGGDRVFAIALSALTTRWCSTCNRGRWGLNFLPTTMLCRPHSVSARFCNVKH